MWKKATWKNGKKKITGKWRYEYYTDSFWIWLDGKDPETERQREPFNVHNEEPNFGNWKLIEGKPK